MKNYLQKCGLFKKNYFKYVSCHFLEGILFFIFTLFCNLKRHFLIFQIST
eukprot:UN25410